MTGMEGFGEDICRVGNVLYVGDFKVYAWMSANRIPAEESAVPDEAHEPLRARLQKIADVAGETVATVTTLSPVETSGDRAVVNDSEVLDFGNAFERRRRSPHEQAVFNRLNVLRIGNHYERMVMLKSNMDDTEDPYDMQFFYEEATDALCFDIPGATPQESVRYILQEIVTIDAGPLNEEAMTGFRVTKLTGDIQNLSELRSQIVRPAEMADALDKRYGVVGHAVTEN